MDAVIRGICTLFVNMYYDPIIEGKGPNLIHLSERTITMEPHEFLNHLNTYKISNNQLRIDLQAIVRQSLKSCNFRRLNDETSSFLVEWINSALGGGNVTNTGQFSPPLSTDHIQITDKTSHVSSIYESELNNTQTNYEAYIPPPSRAGSQRSPKRISTGSSEKASVSRERPVIEKEITKNLTPSEKVELENKRDAIRKQHQRVVKRLPEIVEKPKIYEDSNFVDNTEIAALRYELMKMQRELLRRKVLDPRFYNSISVDSAIKEVKLNQSLRSIDFNEPSKEDTSFQSKREVIVYSKEVSVDKFNYALEMVYNLISERIIFKALQIHDSYSVVFSPAYSIGERQTIRKIDISRVMFHKITNNLFDNFIKDSPSVKALKVSDLTEQLEKSLRSLNNSNSNEGMNLIVSVNRVLLDRSIVVDQVGVDVIVLRNDTCTGLILKCTPKKGKINIIINYYFLISRISLISYCYISNRFYSRAN